MATWTTNRGVIVGVDGSAESSAALDWGAEEASRRGLPLQVLHATRLDRLVAATVLVPDLEMDTPDDITDAAVARVRDIHPELCVVGRATTGSAAHDLVEASERADTVVVGARGHGSVAGRLGSVSLQVAMHSCAPVVVVHAPAPSSGPVVVGVEGSLPSRAALAYAFEQAEHRAVPLTVVTAWQLEFIDGAVVTTPGSSRWVAVERRLAASLEQVLSDLRAAHPAVLVDVRIVHARPADAVVDAAADAGLVVVGARGRGGFRGLLLGSVSHEVLDRCTCPIAVVRGSR